MKPDYKRILKYYLFCLAWVLFLLWPLLGIHGDGTVSFKKTLTVWLYVLVGSSVCLVVYFLHCTGVFRRIGRPINSARTAVSACAGHAPHWFRISFVLAGALALPMFADRYGTDVAINILVYICLGLGLNIVVGLCGMLDLGYIAFYGVGAYTYALLSVHYQLSFWLCLPIAAGTACIAGCIIGYPTLRMRGDYLAIVTLGFGEIVRIILNNWMSLTNGP